MMYNYTFEELLGKTLLIGLTYYSKYGELIERKQLFGTVIKSDNNGITIRKADNKTFTLPPDLSAINIAAPGEYRLKSTSEIVVNPNYLAVYNITKPEVCN